MYIFKTKGQKIKTLTSILLILSFSVILSILASCIGYAATYGKVTTGVLNVREKASSSSKLIGKVSKDTKITILSNSNGWIKTTVSNKTGYVSSKYVSIISNSTTSNKTSTGKTVKVNTDVVNLRASASTSSKVVKKLSKGQALTLISSSNGWSKVKTSSGVTGWVRNDLISAASSPAVKTSIYPYNGAINVSSVNVRSSASTSAGIVQKLSKGTVVKVTGLSNGWNTVTLSNGKKGWIRSDLLSKTSASISRNGDDSSLGTRIVDYAKSFLGTKYVYGANGPSSFDCSGFTSYVYRHFGYSIERTAAGQSGNGVYVSKSNLQPGDLIMFNANGSGHINHVGMYIGNGQFIHASTGAMCVTINDLSKETYVVRYVTSRRIIK
jgi:cell wall-associated NlpC family hydrolase